MALANLARRLPKPNYNWGTAGDPYALADTLYAQGPRGTSDAAMEEWQGRGSTYQPNLNATINGREYTRIGDPSRPSIGINPELFGDQLKQYAINDPNYGWVLPSDMATQLTQQSYTGPTNWLSENMNWFGPAVGMAALGGAAAAGVGGGAGAVEGGTAAGSVGAETGAGAYGLGGTGAGVGLGGGTYGTGLVAPAAAPAGLVETGLGGGAGLGAGTATGYGLTGTAPTAAAGAAAAGGTAISRLLNGTATPSDYASLIGSGIGGATDIYGSVEREKTIREELARQRAERAPFLNTATSWLNDPNLYLSGPGSAAMDATLRGLSVRGNPLGSGTSLALANQAGLMDWRNAVTGFGNMGLSGADTRASLASQQAGAQKGIWDSVGGTVGDIMNPKTDYWKLLLGA